MDHITAWFAGNKLTTFGALFAVVTIIIAQILPDPWRALFTGVGAFLLGVHFMLGTLCWLQDQAMMQAEHELHVTHTANRLLLTRLYEMEDQA